MRKGRLAILTGAAAAVAGAIYLKKKRSASEDVLVEEEMVLDLESSPNGSTERWEKSKSELSM